MTDAPMPKETNARDVLAELVRLKDLKDAVEAINVSGDIPAYQRRKAMITEYERCKPLAWQAARAVLQEKRMNKDTEHLESASVGASEAVVTTAAAAHAQYKAGALVRDVGTIIYLLIQNKHGGSQKSLAKALGISESYLSDMLLRRRDYSDELLAAAGVKRVIEYRFIETGANA